MVCIMRGPKGHKGFDIAGENYYNIWNGGKDG